MPKKGIQLKAGGRIGIHARQVLHLLVWDAESVLTCQRMEELEFNYRYSDQV